MSLYSEEIQHWINNKVITLAKRNSIFSSIDIKVRIEVELIPKLKNSDYLWAKFHLSVSFNALSNGTWNRIKISKDHNGQYTEIYQIKFLVKVINIHQSKC